MRIHCKHRAVPFSLLLLLPYAAMAQSKINYTYQSVFSTSGTVGGKQPLAIKGLDFNDQGDVALLVICADGPAMWQKSRNGWIAWRGKQVTSAQRKEGKITNLGKPSLAANGSLRYRADYTLDDGHSLHGYFVDNKLIYETNRDYLYEVFTPDNKVVLVDTQPVIADGSQLSGKLPTFFPSDANWQMWGGDWHLIFNQHTGKHAFIAGFDESGKRIPAFYLSNAPRFTGPPIAFSSIEGAFLNARDDIAFNVASLVMGGLGGKIFINGQFAGRIGKLLGFNDDRDLLYSSNKGTPDSSDTIWLNDMPIIQRGNQHSYGPNHPIRLGVPNLKERGFVFGFSNEPVLNNKKQIAFAVQFFPVGVFPTVLQIGQQISDVTVNGVKVPWDVMIATPKP